MSDSVRVSRTVEDWARASGVSPRGRLSAMADGMRGSDILRVANEIRALTSAGRTVFDLTIGDFSPKHFPIPGTMARAIQDAVANGQTNYPPTNGLVELRDAVRELYARDLALPYPEDAVTIASGGRALVYGFFRAVCDPGDRVVYGVPSWNNHHYTHMVGAEGVVIECRPEDLFLPTRESLERALGGARLVCLNSPLNPSGTAIAEETLRAICERILEENDDRERRGERPLYLLYDQIYWPLAFEGTPHVTPPGLVPEMARFTVLVDGISKAFAATGLRVGWALGPADVIARMSAFLGHVGAWAPRPEQVGTVAFLRDRAALDEHRAGFRNALGARLRALHDGLERLRAEGLPVECLPPMGAIYLAARFDLQGRRAPDGAVLGTDEDVRSYLLHTAGFGVVAFEAFGARHLPGWFRLSVGAIGPEEIARALDGLAKSLRALS